MSQGEVIQDRRLWQHEHNISTTPPDKPVAALQVGAVATTSPEEESTGRLNIWRQIASCVQWLAAAAGVPSIVSSF